MRITSFVTKNIIRKLLVGEDYRTEVVTLIDTEFLNYVIDFFKRVANAKLENKDITVDWYKRELLSSDLSKEEIAIHSGLNMKTIHNMYNTSEKKVVVEASIEHYDALHKSIQMLVEQEDINLTLIIKFRAVSVELTVTESLIVVNTIAVKRAALRGGIWSAAGKQVEQPLMKTLCAMLRVPKRYFAQTDLPISSREVDFFLRDTEGNTYPCEVKLMGKGNPESADGALAKDTKVFVADKLSDSNKNNLTQRDILWVELSSADALRQFGGVLQKLNIPYKPFTGNLAKAVDRIYEVIFASEGDEGTPTPATVAEERATYHTDYLVDLPEA